MEPPAAGLRRTAVRFIHLILVGLMLAACSTGTAGTDQATSSSVDGRPGDFVGADSQNSDSSRFAGWVSAPRPPNLVVTSGDAELTLLTFGYCWSRRTVVGSVEVECADGAPANPLPSLELAEGQELGFRFPLDWLLTVSFLLDHEHCNGGASITVGAERSPLVDPVPEGRYRVEVFGRGSQGDAAWAFELVALGGTKFPERYLQVLWYPSGRSLEPEAHLVALIGNISEQPEEAMASVEVVAADGAAAIFALTRSGDRGCWSGVEGFEGPSWLTRDVLALGPGPYEVRVSAEIEGEPMAGPAFSWPTDFRDNSNEGPRKTIDRG